MAVHRSDDPTAADWILRDGAPDLLVLGPSGFAAYARLRFIPDPEHPGQDETDAIVDDAHPHDIEQTKRALDLLAPFTTTPDDCRFCIWDGWPDAEELAPRIGPWVVHPIRRYLLLHGSLADVDREDGVLGYLPAFTWPADRSWCLTKDVDPHWAGIGGSQAAIDALLAADDLDVVAARPGDAHPSYWA